MEFADNQCGHDFKERYYRFVIFSDSATGLKKETGSRHPVYLSDTRLTKGGLKHPSTVSLPTHTEFSMAIKTSLRRKIFLLWVIGIVLTIAGTPAVADIEGELLARIIVLEQRANDHEVLLRNQAVEIVNLRSEVQVDLDSLKLQLEKDEQEISLLKSTVEVLTQDMAELKARQNIEPGKKTPPGQNPGPEKPADGESLSLRAPFTVKDASGRVIFKVDNASGNMPRVVVGNPTGSRVEIGLGVGGASVVGLFDDSNKLLSSLVGNPNGSYLRLRDNEQSAGLGKVEGDGFGLFLRKDDKKFGEISAGKTGHGIVKVFGSDGKAVGGMYASAEGGGISLTGPGGGTSAVSLDVEPSGGKVRVFPVKGGKARAELIAEGATGAVNIFDSEGSTAVIIASVTSKAGKMEISNGRGDIVVQAGAQESGRGMVTTGPFEGGLAGTLGGGLTTASTIVGQLKGNE